VLYKSIYGKILCANDAFKELSSFPIGTNLYYLNSLRSISSSIYY